jgi:hypothetical protein
MPYATPGDAHREWHWNTGIPIGTPGCPQDACHPIEYDFGPEYTIEDCTAEFGPHAHDPVECYRMLDVMRGYSDEHENWVADAYAREAEADRLGRPLFPNEY